MKAIAILVAALGACGFADTATVEVEAQIGGNCPSWGCTDNSPLMGPYRFWEGNTAGEPNAQNLRFGDFVIGAERFRPEVSKDVLTACNSTGCRSGKALETGYFEVFSPTGMFQIVVKRVRKRDTSNVTYWVGPATGIETYELAVITPAGTLGDTLCGNPPGRDAGEGGGRAVWNAPLEAILFTGDRYDGDTRDVVTIDPLRTRGWFNIACAGSALAKMHLNRYTSVGSTTLHTTTLDERRALLRMYASYICKGVFTVKGTPIHVATKFRAFTGGEYAFEARWNAAGAQCLDTHRLGSAMVADISATCADADIPMPPCGGSVASSTLPTGTYVMSAVPAPVP